MQRMSLDAEAEKRGCYCKLWDSSPETLQSQGLPYGYCGHCEICKKPAHMRHFPGPVPRTGAWCDHHLRMVMYLHPQGVYGRHLWKLLLLAGVLGYAILTSKPH